MWRRAEHLVLRVYRARSSPVLWPFLGNFLWARLGRALDTPRLKYVTLFSDVTSLMSTVTSYVMSQCCMCISHMTFYYKRSVNALVGGSGLWFVRSSGSTLSPETCVWLVPNACGRDTSSASLGWSLLPSNVIIVLALVNSTVSPAGT